MDVFEAAAGGPEKPLIFEIYAWPHTRGKPTNLPHAQPLAGVYRRVNMDPEDDAAHDRSDAKEGKHLALVVAGGREYMECELLDGSVTD